MWPDRMDLVELTTRRSMVEMTLYLTAQIEQHYLHTKKMQTNQIMHIDFQLLAYLGISRATYNAIVTLAPRQQLAS